MPVNMLDFATPVAETQNALVQAEQLGQQRQRQGQFRNALSQAFQGQEPQGTGEFTAEEQTAIQQAVQTADERQRQEMMDRYNVMTQAIGQVTPENYEQIARGVKERVPEAQIPGTYEEFRQQAPRIQARLQTMGAMLGQQPQQPEVVSASDVTPSGEVITQSPSGGFRAQPVEGFTPSESGAGTQGTETEREINRLTERLRGQVDNPEQVAQDIARGYVEIEQLESGQVRLLDRVAAAAGRGDEAITELPVNPLTEETEEIRPYNTVYDLADQIAGAVPFAKNVWGRLAGQTGANVPESEAEARSFVDTTQQSLISSLRENERFSEAEADRISEMTDLSPAVLDSPDSFRARSRGVADYLRTRQALEERAADNPSLPSGTRESAASAANSIEEYLTFLGAPERLSADDFQSTESINMYPPESVVRYAEEDATAEELDQLPEESRQRILEIVREQRGNR